LLGHTVTRGAVIGSAAMAGDLFSSFVKRRFGFQPSSRATGLDQSPESLFPLLACCGWLPLTLLDILATSCRILTCTLCPVSRHQVIVVPRNCGCSVPTWSVTRSTGTPAAKRLQANWSKTATPAPMRSGGAASCSAISSIVVGAGRLLGGHSTVSTTTMGSDGWTRLSKSDAAGGSSKHVSSER